MASFALVPTHCWRSEASHIRRITNDTSLSCRVGVVSYRSNTIFCASGNRQRGHLVFDSVAGRQMRLSRFNGEAVGRPQTDRWTANPPARSDAGHRRASQSVDPAAICLHRLAGPWRTFGWREAPRLMLCERPGASKTEIEWRLMDHTSKEIPRCCVKIPDLDIHHAFRR